MRQVFPGDGFEIPKDRPKQSKSRLVVPSLPGRVRSVRVVVDVEHTDPSDLVVVLRAPSNDHVLHHRDRHLPRPLEVELVPPRESVGEWILEVSDVRMRDGGRVHGWRLELVTRESEFVTELEFEGPWTAEQKQVLEDAIRRGDRCLAEALEPATLPNGRRVENHLITFRAKPIDGRGGTLGVSGPTHLRWDNDLPIASVQTLDTADRDALFDAAELGPVAEHERWHGQGVGTIWHPRGLLLGAGTTDPIFVGDEARRQYAELTGRTEESVPVANTGGSGSRDAHWRESVFDHELMTPFFDSGRPNPLSIVTLGQLADLGYEVDLTAADEYSLPSAAAAAALRPEDRRRCEVLGRPEPVTVGGPS